MLARILIVIVLSASVSGERPVTPRMPEHVILFAVEKSESALVAEPVVIVRYGSEQRFTVVPSFNSPLGADASEADFKRLEGEFLKDGSKLSVYRGGFRLGAAELKSSQIEGQDGGCSVVSVEIQWSGSGNPLLATNTSTEIPGHQATRRGLTTSERNTLRALAGKWLAEYGLDSTIIRRGVLRPAISAELRPNSGRALIGRIDVRSKRSIHSLFAVAELSNGKYRLTLTDLVIQHDLEDGTDKQEITYVDQLDLNNDGTDEIVLRFQHYESWGYSIWQYDKISGRWLRAYAQTLYGC